MKLRSQFLLALTLLPLFSAGALAAPPPAPPPESLPPDVPDKLDLPTAIRYALENNFAIREARERIREQEGLIITVRAEVLPNVSANAGYTDNAKELSRDLGSPDPSTDNWHVQVGVTQLLYAGGGVRAALSAQSALRQAALLDLQATINDALFDVRTRFYNVLLAREQIKVQESNVELLQQEYQIAKNRFEAGASSKFEVLQAQVALANAQPQLINARNSFRTAIDQLRHSLGYRNPRADTLSKVPDFVGELDVKPVKYDLQSSIDAALANRPDLQRLGRIAEARRAGVRNAQAGYLPTVSVNGGYEVRKDQRFDSFRDYLDGWQVGIASSWAIFDGGATRGRVVQARSQLRQAELETQDQTLTVEVDVRSALSGLQEAAELTDATRQSVGEAEEAVRLADARFSAGTITQLDVLSARNALTQARLNQLQANYQYNVAVASVRRSIGETDPVISNH
jgi:TolC family type I secretion outer membrane protein